MLTIATVCSYTIRRSAKRKVRLAIPATAGLLVTLSKKIYSLYPLVELE